MLLSLLLSVGVFVGLLYLGRGRIDDAHSPALFGAVGWGIVQIAVLIVGLSQPPGRRISRTIRLAVAVVVPVAFLAYLALAASHRLPLGEFFQRQPCRRRLGLRSARLALRSHSRRRHPVRVASHGSDESRHLRSVGRLLGGLAGATAIGIACPSGETWHLWLGHGAVISALAVVGWVSGRRWLAP